MKLDICHYFKLQFGDHISSVPSLSGSPLCGRHLIRRRIASFQFIFVWLKDADKPKTVQTYAHWYLYIYFNDFCGFCTRADSDNIVAPTHWKREMLALFLFLSVCFRFSGNGFNKILNWHLIPSDISKYLLGWNTYFNKILKNHIKLVI